MEESLSRTQRHQKNKGPYRKRRWPWLLGIPVVLIGGAYAAYRYYANPQQTLITPKVAAYNKTHGAAGFSHRITILLLGSSLETAGNTVLKGKHVQNRADTIILVTLDPKTKQVGVLSIPRDTRVNIPHVGMTKIAESTFFGGVPGAVRVIQQNFHVPIDYYAFLGMFQLPKIINDMGGLTVNVPHNEVYEANGDPLGINLKKGIHHLNGNQVLQFVRFRNTSQGDISRIQQQQQILKDMAHQLLTPQEIPRWPTIASDTIHALSNTNLNLGQLISLGLMERSLHVSSVRFATVPGHASTHMDPFLHTRLSYWSYDPRLTSVLIQNVLLGQPLTKTQKSKVAIAIESGTGSLAPAQHLAQVLTAKGYHVLGVGWANHHNHQRSVIQNTSGDKWLGQDVAAGLGPSQVSFTAYHTTPWDLKIVVGSDYRYHSSSKP